MVGTTTSLDSYNLEVVLEALSLQAIIIPSVFHQLGRTRKVIHRAPCGAEPYVITLLPTSVIVTGGCSQHDLRAQHPLVTNLLSNSAKTVTTFLQQLGITKMDQPAKSSDCDPIEPLWGNLGLAISRIDSLLGVWAICDPCRTLAMQSGHRALGA